MKIELNENKVFLENKGLKKEIHPFWLRERIDGDKYIDQITQQRLFDPTEPVSYTHLTLPTISSV